MDHDDIESLGFKNAVHENLYYFDIPNVQSRSNEYFLNDKLISFPDYEMIHSSNCYTIKNEERGVVFLEQSATKAS